MAGLFSTRPSMERDLEDPDYEPVEVLRLRYCVLVGVVAGVAALAGPLWLPPTGAFVWSHWSWFLLFPATAVPVLISLDNTSRAAPIAITVVGVVAALQIDGIISLPRVLRSNFGSIPIWLWLAALALAAAVAWALRQIDRWDVPEVMPFSVVVAAAAALVYIGCRAVARWITAEDLSKWAILLREHWPPVALLASVMVLTVRVRSVLYADRYRYDYDGYEPREDRPPVMHRSSGIADPNLSSSGTMRGHWLLRIFAAARATGVSFGDGLLILTTLVLFGVTVLYYVPDQIVGAAHLSATSAAKARAEERRTALAMLAAVGAGVTLVYTHLRHQLDRDAATSTRFTDGVTNMATESLSTRLGGIYALGQVARQSARDAENVVEVLSAFTRESTEGREWSPEDTPVTAVTLAGLRVLSDTPPGTRPPDLTGVNLSHASFEALSCRRSSNFADADFRASGLVRSDLGGAILVRAKLQASTWSSSSLSASDMRGVDASSAVFDGCDLRRTNLDEAVLRGARLTNVILTYASLRDCDLQGASLAQCQCEGAELVGADLRGCDLRGAALDGANLEGVQHDGDTRWPEGFDFSRLSGTASNRRAQPGC